MEEQKFPPAAAIYYLRDSWSHADLAWVRKFFCYFNFFWWVGGEAEAEAENGVFVI